MQPRTRVMIAAAAYAVISGRKVVGVYDHAAGRHLKIAAECRGDRVQGLDGERSVRFGGTLPNLYDEGGKAYVSLEIEGGAVRGHDQASAQFYAAEVTDGLVQFYDYADGAWFSFGVQTVEGEAAAIA